MNITSGTRAVPIAANIDQLMALSPWMAIDHLLMPLWR